MNSRVLVSSAMLAVCLVAPPLLAQCGDYDGDGFDDLPAGSSWEDVGGIIGAGAVNVIYGTGDGLKANDDQFFTRATAGIAGDPFQLAYFGHAVASGDFDGDGFEDLAIGTTFDNVDGVSNAGSVTVLYGRSGGLSVAGDQLWHRGRAGVAGNPGPFVFLGYALAAGDFDGDGFDDLAIGVPSDDVNGIDRAGSVHVLYGSSAGLRAAGDQVFSQDTAGIQDQCEEDDQFGYALTAGDFDGDGRDDLGIGVPAEAVDGVQVAGALAVIYGSPNGLTAAGDQFLHQNSPGVRDSAQGQDAFGLALASGDFDGDGRHDMAITVHAEGLGGLPNVGAVAVLYGSSNGLSAANDQLWHQDAPGVQNANEADQYFGFSIAAGDFDDDGRDDLAIGIVFETVSSLNSAGAVAVLYGTNNGLTAAGDQFIHEDVVGVKGEAFSGGRFGTSLYVGDFDRDGRDDLGIAKAYGDVKGSAYAGSLAVLYGTSSGIGFAGDQVWTQDSSGIKDVSEPADFFATLRAEFFD